MEYVERFVETVGKEENVVSLVVFPCNEDDLKVQFQVEDINDLRFATCESDSWIPLSEFNRILLQSEKIFKDIDDRVKDEIKSLKGNLEKNPGLKETIGTVELSIEEVICWDYCIRNYYMGRYENVLVCKVGGRVTVCCRQQKGR